MKKERTFWCLTDRKHQCKWKFELLPDDTIRATFNRYDGKFKNERKIMSREKAREMWRQLKVQGFRFP